MDKYVAVVLGVILIGSGLGVFVGIIAEWRRNHYTPPKWKRRSTWQKPKRGRHRA